MTDIKTREIPRLIFSILVCQAAGVAGSVFTSTTVSSWYPTLIKPGFTPPGWVIGLVWTVLFTLMGLALFLVWRRGLGRPEVKGALVLFALQLLVNVLWSGAFFGLRSPLAGLVVIVVLWVLILATMARFWRVSREAAMLLLPYLAWVSFAAYLNYVIWMLNP